MLKETKKNNTNKVFAEALYTPIFLLCRPPPGGERTVGEGKCPLLVTVFGTDGRERGDAVPRFTSAILLAQLQDCLSVK